MTQDLPRTPRAPLHRNRDYIALVSAQGLSITGREIETLALPLLVLALTGSPAQVGLVAAVQSLPYLLLSLPAGALVDRWDRRWVMIACDAIRALAFASLPAAWLLGGGLGLPQIYLVALVAGAAFVFYNIAEISSLALVVDAPQLPRATSNNVVVEWIAENAGPALGGALIGLRQSTVAGAMIAYAAQAALLTASLFLLGAIRRPLRAATAALAPRGLVAEMRAGMAWLFAHRQIRAMAFLAMALNVLFGPVTLAMIVMARDEFHASPVAIGLMFSAGGIVGLASTLAAPFVRRRVAVGTILVTGVAVWAGGLSAIAGAGSMIALTLAWLILPGVSGVQEVTGVSYRLSLIPDEMQGRVNSVFRFLAWGIRPATLAGGGWAIGAFGPKPVLWALAAGMAVTAVAAFLSPLRTAR